MFDQYLGDGTELAINTGSKAHHVSHFLLSPKPSTAASFAICLLELLGFPKNSWPL